MTTTERGRGEAYDAIALEVLWSRLTAIADEMAAALVRTSHSTIVREGSDFACVVMDSRGLQLAQSTRSVPGFALLLPRTTQAILKQLPAAGWRPGDVVVTNDPWLGNGHLPDLSMIVPAFARGRLIGFSGTVAHLPDIGGRQLSGAASEIYEEGLRLPVARLYREGELDRVLWDVVRANVRVPEQVLGDLDAQRATNLLGVERLCGLLAELGADDFDAVATQVHARSDAAFRRAVEQVADGDYRGRVAGDGFSEPVWIEALLCVRGDAIEIDFSGSSPRTQHGNNVPFPYAIAYTHYALKCVIDPLTPSNEGCFRAVTVTAPDDCVLNARPPAAVAARHTVGHLIPSVVFAALADALPDSVPAESGTPLWALCFTGEKDGRDFSIFPSFSGGQGASRRADGLPCLSFPGSDANTPVEVVEALTTLHVVEKRLIRDSGGAGAHRGGAGQRIVLRATADTPVKVTMFSDKIRTRAFGLHGGAPGAPGAITVNGVPVEHPKGELLLRRDDVLAIELPGGGGYGSPG